MSDAFSPTYPGGLMHSLIARAAQQAGHGLHPSTVVTLVRHYDDSTDYTLSPEVLKSTRELVDYWERENGTHPHHLRREETPVNIRKPRLNLSRPSERVPLTISLDIPTESEEVATEVIKRVETDLPNLTRQVESDFRSIVGVKFPGSATTYHYKLLPEERDLVDVGDRVAVESPMSGRTEFPRVKQFGYTKGYKQASKYARALPDPKR